MKLINFLKVPLIEFLENIYKKQTSDDITIIQIIQIFKYLICINL